MSLPTVRLGKSGAKVTRIALGTMGFGSKQWRPWVIEEKESIPIIKKALDLGINLVDTADMYSIGESERIVGKAIKGRRDDIVLATKVYYPMGEGPNDRGLSRRHILASLQGSLDRLGTDHVDLYQIHRFDHETPLDEVLSTLDGIVADGRVRYLGASTMWAWQLAMCLGRQRERGWHPFVTMQDHYNLAYREEEREMIPLCRHEGIGLLPWSPLARGFLAGTAKRKSGPRAESDHGRGLYRHPTDLEIAKRVDAMAQEKGVTSAQVALAWLLHRPGVVAPIVGVTKAQHIEDAVAALDLRLDEKEVQYLAEPYRPKGVAGWFRSSDVPREHLDELEFNGAVPTPSTFQLTR